MDLNASSILQSEEEKPKGFEKFFKKNKDKEEKESAKKDDKEAKKASQEESDEEEETNTENNKDKDEKQEDDRNQFQKFFFDPENNPKPEGFVGVLLALATGYYLFNYKKPRKEITMIEFINQ